MALGEFKWFQWKSKKQLEKEAQQYAAWAFPHGDIQREKLTALFKELKPKEAVEIILASFLTCKELYEDALEDSESREDAVKRSMNSIRGYSQLVKKDDATMYLAVVLADADIDELCEYPSVEEIRVRIQELNELLIKKKKNKKI